jgi:hypothetical protein
MIGAVLEFFPFVIGVCAVVLPGVALLNESLLGAQVS